MLGWALNLGFAGSGTPDAPSVPTATKAAYVQKTSPNAWGTRWRTTAWIRLRPLWAA